MKSIRLSSPLSDACAIACALVVFAAAILEAPVRAEPITGPAEAAAAGPPAPTGTTPAGALRRTPR